VSAGERGNTNDRVSDSVASALSATVRAETNAARWALSEPDAESATGRIIVRAATSEAAPESGTVRCSTIRHVRASPAVAVLATTLRFFILVIAATAAAESETDRENPCGADSNATSSAVATSSTNWDSVTLRPAESDATAESTTNVVDDSCPNAESETLRTKPRGAGVAESSAPAASETASNPTNVPLIASDAAAVSLRT
jgi:hypothetical protein